MSSIVLLAALPLLSALPAGAVQPAAPTGSAIILAEPDMPVVGAGSSGRTIAQILTGAGIASRLVSARQLADPQVLNVATCDILVLPTGQSFPAGARAALVHFLHGGGSLITMGGYAFNHLLQKENGKWLEQQLLKARRRRAARIANSLVRDGQFELPLTHAGHDPPALGAWHADANLCAIVEDGPHEGRSCARLRIGQDTPQRSASLWQDVPATASASYQVSGWLKTRRVIESGIAYIALYQFDAEGKRVTFKDFAVARGNSNWTYYQFRFVPEPAVTRLHIQFGLYQTQGTAWFDDVRLADITGALARPLNTSSGRPADGLQVAAEQIGMFDASFRLERACRLRTAAAQQVVSEPVDLRRNLTGWAAAGVVGPDRARWIPLLQTFDHYDRPRGAAAALLLNYAGYYAGSCWAYFGVENVDLLAQPAGPMARLLQDIARFLLHKTFLHNLATDRRLYRPGEPVSASVVVDNRGRRPQRVRVRFLLRPEGTTAPPVTAQQSLVVEPHAAQQARVTFPAAEFTADLYQVDAVMALAGKPVDQMSTGLVVERPEVLKSGAELRFRDNYFTLDGRPMFLFGSDTYSYTYTSAHENPLTWSQDHRAARDMGVNLYENLQYSNPAHKMTDKDWRAFRAMSQLTQKYRLVFMPGMLIGHNVAVGDALLAQQSEQCRGYAEQLGATPGLLYYVNGDYKMGLDEHPQEVQTLWNRWLATQYETTAQLRSAWGAAAGTAELGNIACWPPNSGRWDDVAATDRLRFQNWLTRRWNEAQVAAIRRHDQRHPITSEYYQIPWGGLDLVQTIDGQDVANIGFFDKPGADLENLPLKLRLNDLRARGKGVSLGEYGVKVHPAWSVANGAQNYHIARTQQQQIQLFLAVAHYGLGLGACKVQNWCLRDAQASIFPWGIFYPNQLIPKGVAYVHRNLSFVWRHFSPRYEAPALTVCVPNQLRLGNYEAVGRDVAERSFATLLGLHYDFNVIDDAHLDRLPAATRVLIYPAPFALPDDAYTRLAVWVKGGGTLLVSGDISYDQHRQRTRTDRLEQLAGARFVAQRYANIARPAAAGTPATFTLPPLPPRPVEPCIKVRAVGAEVLGRTAGGDPVLVRNALGHGHVYLFLDPIELATGQQAASTRRLLYQAVLRAATVAPLAVAPDEPWLYVMAQRTARGTVHVVVNRKQEAGRQDVQLGTAAGRLTLATRNGWPALAAVTDDGKVVAASAFGTAAIDDAPLLRGTGLKAILALDGKDLRQSQALVVAPFESGTLTIPDRLGKYVAVVGEFRGGRWTSLERVDLAQQQGSLKINPDRATSLILLCPPNRQSRWASQLTGAVLHPSRIRGY